MKPSLKICLLSAAACLSPIANRELHAAHLTAGTVAVLDLSNAARNSFSNTEKIIVQQRVSNSISSSNRLIFAFKILNPSGVKVFDHYGNAAPGTIGDAQTQVAGIPISQFYTGPGIYQLIAEAFLDGETLQQQTSFTVSSPIITLTYPPNGMRDLADSPVVLFWVASGASRYKVFLDDDPSFYNLLFSQETLGLETSFSYPENPSDQRQKLAAGQIYYWRVEGLDPNGNKVSESGVPFNFSIQSQAAALTRDLAVTELSIIPPATSSSKGSIPFRVTVKNQGGTSETNISLRFTLGGLPAPDSPKSLTLSPGESRELTLSAALPPDLSHGLAIACLELFDDNVPNNCRTLPIQTGGPPPPPVGASGKAYSLDEIWNILREALGSGEIEKLLEGYRLTDISGLPAEELNKLILQVAEGNAKVLAPEKPQAFAAAPSPSPVTPALPSLLPQAKPIAAPEEAAEEPQEWSGGSALKLPQTQKIVIRQERSWKKFWPRLSQEPVPQVDFKKYMVVGILAGAQDRARSVQIQGAEVEEERLLIQYSLSGRETAEQTLVPYHLKAVLRSQDKVRFTKVR